MQIIDRLILKEFTKYLFGSMLFFTGIALISKIIETSPIIINTSAEAKHIWLMYLYYMPMMITVVVGPSFLFSIVMTINNLVHTRELIIIRSSGYSIRRVLLPTILFSLFFTIPFFVFNEKVAFPSNYLAYIKHNYLRGRGPDFQMMRSRYSFEIRSGNLFFYIDLFDPSQKYIKNLYLLELHNDRNIKRVIEAEEAWIIPSNWKLKNGSILYFSDKGNLIGQNIFKETNVDIKENYTFFQRKVKSIDMMNLEDIFYFIQLAQKKGESFKELMIHTYWHFSFPFICFFVVVIGGFISSKSRYLGLSGSLALCVVFGLIYFLVMYYGISLGNKDLLPPFIAGSASNFLFGIPSAILLLFFKE